MALQYISAYSNPSYLALSSDIIDNKISGVSLVGKTVYLVDSGKWKIINKDLTLSDYNVPSIIPNGALLSVGTSATAMVVSQDFHYRVHLGTLWSLGNFTNGVIADAVLDFGLVTGNNSLHISLSYTAAGDALVETYASPVFTGGTELTPLNHKTYVLPDVSSPLSKFYKSPTISDYGVLKRQNFIPGGTGGNKSGGVSPFSTEFIIAPNQKMILKYTNLASTSSKFGILADFYEE